MLNRYATKKVKHFSKAETISELTVQLQLLQNYFSPAKTEILTLQENVPAKGGVSEFRALYPMHFAFRMMKKHLDGEKHRIG